MRLELTPTQVAEVKPWLEKCRETSTPCVLAGQIMRGDFDNGGVDKVYLHYAIIRPETALKIRKLILREREKERSDAP